jgi:hypothetical protein
LLSIREAIGRRDVANRAVEALMIVMRDESIHGFAGLR